MSRSDELLGAIHMQHDEMESLSIRMREICAGRNDLMDRAREVFGKYRSEISERMQRAGMLLLRARENSSDAAKIECYIQSSKLLTEVIERQVETVAALQRWRSGIEN